MLDDIKKILEVSKKGIVIMEDGKPAYVVVPFEDYIENTKNAKSVSNREEGNHLLDTIKEEESFSQKIPSIENIFEDRLSFDNKKTVAQKSDIITDNTSVNTRELDGHKKDLREIRLEDLPF
jgi:PHD/YefM family antitoxin component YafN of YafNO toxin-antitoxin module